MIMLFALHEECFIVIAVNLRDLVDVNRSSYSLDRECK